MELSIHDKDGEWFLSSAKYGFTDPLSGARFEPGVYTQAKATEWTKGQDGWLSKVANPLASDPAQAETPKPPDNPKPKKP